MAALLWFGLAYMLFAAGLQYLGIRLAGPDRGRGMKALVGIELVAVGMLGMAFLYRKAGLLAWGHTLAASFH